MAAKKANALKKSVAVYLLAVMLILIPFSAVTAAADPKVPAEPPSAASGPGQIEETQGPNTTTEVSESPLLQRHNLIALPILTPPSQLPMPSQLL